MACLSAGHGTPQRDRALRLLDPAASEALVIDDLDKTRATEYGAEQVFLAIDGAVANGRPLLVMSQAGFGGDLETRMICPGGSRGSVDVPSPQVRRRAA